MDRLLESVKQHEGLRLKAYRDSVQVWTIGYGTNLQTLEIDEPLAALWLDKRLNEAVLSARGFPEWGVLSQPRQDVIVEMIYNLGPKGYEGFVNTRKAMLQGRYADAARGMLASKWAEQVGRRAWRLAEQMERGIAWQDLDLSKLA